MTLWGAVLFFTFVWALGSVASVTLGGFIHLLMVATFVLLLFRLLKTPRRKGLPDAASW